MRSGGLLGAATIFFIIAIIFSVIAQDEHRLMRRHRDRGISVAARSHRREFRHTASMAVGFGVLTIIELYIFIWG